MNIEVRYCSKTGNTKKLADAMANALGVEARSVDAPMEGKVDLLLLGSAMYGASVDESVKAFIQKLSPNHVKKIACFSTTAIAKSTFAVMSKLLAKQGLDVAAEEYHCKGAFKILHKRRPNDDDIAKAVSFAKAVKAKYSE